MFHYLCLRRKCTSCWHFPTGRAKRLVRVLLNSSSDRRVLDQEHPVSSQPARDRQSIKFRPGGSNSTPLSERRPANSHESISSATCKRSANRLSARLAIQLDARPQPFRIFSNVSSLQDQTASYAIVRVAKPAYHGLQSSSCGRRLRRH